MKRTELTIADVAALLQTGDHFLLLTHEKPDGDAIGSTLGLLRLLRAAGKTADALFPDPLPQKYAPIVGRDYLTHCDAERLGRYRYVVILDSARASRTACGPAFTPADLTVPVINIDHHIDNDLPGSANLVLPDAAATAEIITEISAALADWRLPAEAATLLYLGIVTDTGSFRFSNTTAETFRAAARLLAAGAKIEEVVNAAFFSKTRNQQLLEAEMVRHCLDFRFDGRCVIAELTQELLDRHHFDMRDGEAVIELLREIDTVKVALLLYPRDGALKVSLRSKDPRYPVGPVARSFGGGGHELAAGITVRDLAPEALKEKLCNEIGKLFAS